MNTFMNRLMVAALVISSIAASAPALASSYTGTWQWSDISDKLSIRENRPVWVIARAEPYWYMTDGQDLTAGGHVWRTDGSIVSDITSEVRNAGLNRVDDIVSDGQSVIYLKNITRSDRNFEALSYRNGSYSSVTYILQQYLNQDEGITSITGKDGSWMIVTNRGRVYNWNQTNNQIGQLSLPASPNYANYPLQSYALRHVSPPDGSTNFNVTQAVPTSNGWLIVSPQTGGNYLRAYFYSNGNYTDLTGQMNLYSIQTIASNGNQVLIVGGDNTYSSNRAYVVEGSSVRSVGSYLPSINWNKSVVSYNGKSWLIVADQNVTRFDGTNFQTYNQTSDYFTTAAGSGSGTYLLGGAVSTAGLNSPTSPLTAKLVRVDEGVNYVDNTTYTTSASYSQSTNYDTSIKVGTINGTKNKITYWSWFNPDQKYQANTTNPVYTVGAQSNDGIKTIELCINDVYQKTCSPGNTKKNTECSMSINPNSWQLNSNVGAFAKITSGKNKVAYVPASIIQFYGNDVTANMTVDNSTPYLMRGTTNNATITGSSSGGINRIEIYVNGIVKKSCSINSTYGTCSVGLNGNDYNVGSIVSFNGKVITNAGQEAWGWLGTYTVTDYNSNYNYNNNQNNTGTNGNLSTWVWTDPSGTDFSSSDSKTIMSQANAGDGLQKVGIIVNGVVKKTCDFNRAYGTQSCQVTIYGSNYSNLNSIPVYVRATDYFGRQATSQTLYLNTNYNNTSNSLSTYVDVNGSTNLSRNENRSLNFYGTSNNGLHQLDLYANDSLVGTCTYSDITNSQQTCSRSINGGNYSQGTYVTLKSKATDRYGYTVWSTNNPQLYITSYSNDNNNNTNASVTLSTTGGRTSYGLSESFTLTAQANDPDGIKRIDLYANNVLVNSQTFSNTTYATFATNVVGSSYPSGSMSLPLQAKITDGNYNTSWSDVKYVQIGSQYNDNNNYNSTATLSLSPDKTSYSRNESFTVNATAYDGNGIQKMEVYVNNAVKQTCNSSYNTSANCSATVYTGDYSGVTYLPIQVRVTDNNSNVSWSDTRNVQLSEITNNQDNNNQDDVIGSLSISSTADSGYNAGQSIAFTANGSDGNGIQKIELYVNADLVKTCTDGNSTCSYTNSYSTNSLTYGAKLIDNLGNSIWNGYKTIYKK
ncbi:MAG: Ig-like domain-containing protein [Patescibacteria group bacterium]